MKKICGKSENIEHRRPSCHHFTPAHSVFYTFSQKQLLIKFRDSRSGANCQVFTYLTLFILKTHQKVNRQHQSNCKPGQRSLLPRRSAVQRRLNRSKLYTMLWFCYLQGGPGRNTLPCAFIIPEAKWRQPNSGVMCSLRNTKPIWQF